MLFQEKNFDEVFSGLFWIGKKAIELGATVLTLSDSGGYIFDEEGINSEKLKHIMFIKNEKRGRNIYHFFIILLCLYCTIILWLSVPIVTIYIPLGK